MTSNRCPALNHQTKRPKNFVISPHFWQVLRGCTEATLAFVVFAILAGASARADEGGSFLDDFDTFDRTRWFASDGWSNGKWQNCLFSRRQVRLSKGILTLSYVKQKTESHEYSCAEIQSHKQYGYGTYEVRLRTGSGPGLVGAFFTYIGPHFKKPHDEIDFEVLLRDTSKVTVTTYVTGKAMYGASLDVPGGTDGGFNDYAFVWEKDRMRWFINGKLAHEVTSADGPMPTNLQKIYSSIWGSDNSVEWLGAFEEPPGPVVMEIDRIAFTRLGEPCQFAGSVACGL
jgi:endo-1,3-1,4-beta-glycanase ExoK